MKNVIFSFLTLSIMLPLLSSLDNIKSASPGSYTAMDTAINPVNIRYFVQKPMTARDLKRWSKDSSTISIHGLTFYIIHDTAWKQLPTENK